MPDEKRIKDFEPATDLLIDDWFAVDSPSQGTRKMQASMFQEGLQTQITTNTENIALHSGQISVLQQGVGNIGDKVDVLDAAITVEEYSATKLYAVDEDCVYEGVRYKCTTAIETPEAFTPSHWQAISIEGELNELNSSKVNKINTQLTLTRTANNYVDAASFARLAAVRKDNVLFFICNLALSSSIPASALSDFVEIGRISGWSSAYTIMQQIPSQQSDGNSLSIRVTSNGIVSIYAVKASSSWYRTVVSIPASN